MASNKISKNQKHSITKILVLIIWLCPLLLVGSGFGKELAQLEQNLCAYQDQNDDVNDLLYLNMYYNPEILIKKSYDFINQNKNDLPSKDLDPQLALQYYTSGVAIGLANPILSSKFLMNAFRQYDAMSDTLGMIHALYFRLRLNYDIRMYEITDISNTNLLYEKLVTISRDHKHPISQLLYASSVMMYNDYHCGFEDVAYYTPYMHSGQKALEKIKMHKEYYGQILYVTNALIYSKNSQIEAAIEWLYKAEKNSNPSQTYNYKIVLLKLGSLLRFSGSTEKGLAYLLQAEKKMSGEPSNYFDYYIFELDAIINKNIFLCYQTLKQYDKAMTYLEKMDANNHHYKMHTLMAFTKDYDILVEKEQNLKKLYELTYAKKNLSILTIILIGAIMILLMGYVAIRVYLNSLNEKNRYQDVLFTTIGHDISSPLIQLEYLIKDQFQNSNDHKLIDDNTEILTLMQNKVKSIDNVLSSLLILYSAKSVSSSKQEKEKLDLMNIVKEQTEITKSLYKDNIQSWDLSLIESNSSPLYGNKGNYEILIRNILSNIRRHSDANKVKITTTTKKQSMMITIADDGISWPENYKQFMVGNIAMKGQRPMKLGVGSYLIKYFLDKTGVTLTYTRNGNQNLTILTLNPNKNVGWWRWDIK